MKLEKFKTVLLTVLVLVSIILFWNLVTFQQNYEMVNNQDYVKEIYIIDKKMSEKELIVPNKIIFRDGKNNFTGIQNMDHITSAMDRLKGWKFSGFQRSNNELAKKFSNAEKNQVLIFQFPSELPMDLLKSLFTVETTEIPGDEFRNIFIFQQDLKGENGVVYFASNDFTSVVKANIRSASTEHYKKIAKKIREEGISYLAYEKSPGSFLFLPDEPVTLENEQYYPRLYDKEIFVDALFKNPGMLTISDQEYTDGSALLKVDQDLHKLTYVDTTVNDSPGSLHDMIKTGINYINGHGGWTDQYYFSGAYFNASKVYFQLYAKNYPVFNERGLNEIELKVGNNKVHSYERPYFRLDFITFNPDNERYTLPPGSEVLAHLEKSGIDITAVEDMLIGYHMQRDQEKAVIKLQPSWFYKIGQSWVRIPLELGGVNNGLE